MSIVYKVFNKPQVPSGFFISLNEKKKAKPEHGRKMGTKPDVKGRFSINFINLYIKQVCNRYIFISVAYTRK